MSVESEKSSISTKQRIKDALRGSSVYGPVRTFYQICFDRDAIRYRVRMKRFYGQFIHAGDVVFDIGANRGEYSDLFSRLGATVVAAEPNPSCCKLLAALAKDRNIRVEEAAIGASVGTAKLRLCDESELSTLSEDWFENSHQSATYATVKWLDQIEVPILTLDVLAQKHGVPSFVKIDVEGFEENVIKGMSFSPKFVSFEFSNVKRENAQACILALGGRGFAFRPMLSRDFSFSTDQWLSADEAASWLRDYQGKEEFGDIFAKASDPSRITRN
jgi:FkbM family methyltransferase